MLDPINDFFAGRYHFDAGLSAPDPEIYSELFIEGYEHAVLCSVRDALIVLPCTGGVI